MKKRICVLIGILLLSMQNIFCDIFEAVFKRSAGSLFKLEIPYKSQSKRQKKHFDSDTPYAIDVLEISVDGEILEKEWDGIIYEPYYKYEIVREKSSNSYFFISMIWEKNSKGEFVWNDRRGGQYSYKVKRGGKKLKLRYRVLFPFPFMTIKKLRMKQVPAVAYSPEHEVTVNLGEIFE